jgi:hypothetical protein
MGKPREEMRRIFEQNGHALTMADRSSACLPQITTSALPGNGRGTPMLSGA